MSLSKSKCWYSNNCLWFLKCVALFSLEPIGGSSAKSKNTDSALKNWRKLQYWHFFKNKMAKVFSCDKKWWVIGVCLTQCMKLGSKFVYLLNGKLYWEMGIQSSCCSIWWVYSYKKHKFIICILKVNFLCFSYFSDPYLSLKKLESCSKYLKNSVLNKTSFWSFDKCSWDELTHLLRR